MDDNWKVSKINLIRIIITVVLAIAFIIWRNADNTTGAKLILNGVKNTQFSGKVDAVYRDKKDHNSQKVRLDNGYIYGLYPEWESEVEPGDSLKKQMGTTTVIVVKRDGSTVSLDYKKLIRDFKN